MGADLEKCPRGPSRGPWYGEMLSGSCELPVPRPLGPAPVHKPTAPGAPLRSCRSMCCRAPRVRGCTSHAPQPQSPPGVPPTSRMTLAMCFEGFQKEA